MRQTLDSRYLKVLSRIRGKIALSRGALWLEHISRSFWPLFTLLLFAYAFIAFGGLELLSRNNGLILIGAFAICAVLLSVIGIRKFKIPKWDNVLDRLDDGQDGRPLATLRDTVATGHQDHLTKVLWDRHQERMVEKAVNVSPSAPDLRLASRDKYGLRLMGLVFAFTAIAFAPRNVIETIQNVVVPPTEAAIADISFEAWANPPSYTGKPAIYLSEVDADQQLLLPEGSEIIVRVYGSIDHARLDEAVSGNTFQLSGDQDGLKSAEFTAEKPGMIQLLDGEDVLGAWNISIEPDLPPTVSMPEAPTRNATGAMQLSFEAYDDYGVASGTAVITLDLENVDRRYGLTPNPVELEPIVVELPMPFSGDTTKVIETAIEDYSEHLWANLPVTIMLTVKDDAGQEGTEVFTSDSMPARRFYVPLAATFAEQRRDLLWSPENDARILSILKAATFLPEDLGLSATSYLMVRTLIRRLGYMIPDGLSDAERVEITDLMWEVANLLEDGDLSDARERLRRAQERLARALEENADEAELSQLMDELREATEDYLQALSDEARENGETQQAENSDGPTISQDQLQQMMDELQRLTENGQTEEAQEMLEALQELLENLQMAQQQGQGQGQEQGENGEQMQEMQDALNQQQDLSDETYQELQESLREGGKPQNGQELADKQEELRELLDGMQQEGAGRESLEEAERNMGEARDRLEQGDPSGALDQQAEAMENLRQGLRELAEEMQNADQEGNGQSPSGSESADVDPLGRPLSSGGQTTTSEQLLPNQNAVDRARELLDEIRRRSSEGDRPVIELEYLERLLDRF